jgi:hypothetical protein
MQYGDGEVVEPQIGVRNDYIRADALIGPQ